MLFADCDRTRLVLGDGCSSGSASNEGSVRHASTALSAMALIVATQPQAGNAARRTSARNPRQKLGSGMNYTFRIITKLTTAFF